MIDHDNVTAEDFGWSEFKLWCLDGTFFETPDQTKQLDVLLDRQLRHVVSGCDAFLGGKPDITLRGPLFDDLDPHTKRQLAQSRRQYALREWLLYVLARVYLEFGLLGIHVVRLLHGERRWFSPKPTMLDLNYIVREAIDHDKDCGRS